MGPAVNDNVNSSKRPLVTVVITSFNSERFLNEAIESVLAQSYPEWELILVDDGSTDDSPAIARRHAERDPGRIRYIEHPGHVNHGASASRNLGAREARGEYLAFLDSDDVWTPMKLMEQVELLNAHSDAVMVYGPALWWYGWTGRVRDQRLDRIQSFGSQADVVMPVYRLLELFLGNENVVPSMSGPLIRRKTFERVGGSEEHCRSIYDDQVVYAKLACEGKIIISSAVWYSYRQHPSQRNSMSVSGIPHQLAIRKEYLNWLDGRLRSLRINDRALWEALELERRPYSSHAWYVLEYARYIAGCLKRRAVMRTKRWFAPFQKEAFFTPSNNKPSGVFK